MPVYYPDLPPIVWTESFFVVGLTGSIASGKSLARSFFHEAGANCLDADQMAKDSFSLPEVQKEIAVHFGSKMCDPHTKEINRKDLAQIVFSDPEKRQTLNSIVHPQVRTAMVKQIQKLQPSEILVYDVPLLFETKRDINIHLTISLDVPRLIRYERAFQRNSWTKEEFLKREQSQFSPDKKKAMADLVIRNTDSQEELHTAVFTVYQAIQKSYKK